MRIDAHPAGALLPPSRRAIAAPPPPEPSRPTRWQISAEDLIVADPPLGARVHFSADEREAWGRVVELRGSCVVVESDQGDLGAVLPREAVEIGWRSDWLIGPPEVVVELAASDWLPLDAPGLPLSGALAFWRVEPVAATIVDRAGAIALPFSGGEPIAVPSPVGNGATGATWGPSDPSTPSEWMRADATVEALVRWDVPPPDWLGFWGEFFVIADQSPSPETPPHTMARLALMVDEFDVSHPYKLQAMYVDPTGAIAFASLLTAPEFASTRGRWHAVAVVVGGGELRFYVDGALKTTVPGRPWWEDGMQPFAVLIGNDEMTGGPLPPGSGIATLALYPGALTEAELVEHARRCGVAPTEV